MESSDTLSDKINVNKLKDIKSRFHCLIGSILVISLIWFICTYYNSMESLTIDCFQISAGFIQKWCDKFDRLSAFVHYIITSIIGVTFLYCFCGFISERNMIFLEKTAFIISGILLLVALLYKFNDDGTSFYNVFKDVSIYGIVAIMACIPALFILLYDPDNGEDKS